MTERAYKYWDDDENMRLVAELRMGLPVDEIAVGHQRSIRGAQTHCRLLPAPHAGVCATRAVEVLRESLDYPFYDLPEGPRAQALRDRRYYLEPDKDVFDGPRAGPKRYGSS
jgi:hypothetical protein